MASEISVLLLLLCCRSILSHANDVDVNLPYQSTPPLVHVTKRSVLLQAGSHVTPSFQGCSCSSLPFSSCAQVQEAGYRTSGAYTLCVGTKEIEVYCDLETDGGGWTMIQRRDDFPPPLDFERGWVSYQVGFGEVQREFWLGLHYIHKISSMQPHSLRIDLHDFDGNTRYASYSHFYVGPESSQYRLLLQGYNGNAGDSFSPQNHMQFTTKDRDNDIDETKTNCAVQYKGAWWHAKCHESNLNGKYLRGNHSTFADGVDWKQWLGYHYSLKKTEMKIRPVAFQPYKIQ